MTTQLIPQEILHKSKKILFVTHLALGDFTYMEPCFKAFHETYPHIEIHLWVDELRRTYDFRQWQGLKNYSLFSWLESVPYFRKVYKETYSPFVFLRSLFAAKSQQYPVVVAFGLAHRSYYAQLVHSISKTGFVAAIAKRYRPRKTPRILQRRIFERLDALLQEHPENAPHVSDIYAAWFGQLFGLEISKAQRRPHMEVPLCWTEEAQARLQQWGIRQKSLRQKRLIFVNHLSKQAERSWSIEKTLDLIGAIRKLDVWSDSDFIFNTVPEQWKETQAAMAGHVQGDGVHLFSATENFFQLPAILQQCDLIISVETAVMHLANAVKVPVIALMRQHTPEWVPIDADNSRVIMTLNHDDWVEHIALERVIAALPNFVDMQWPTDKSVLNSLRTSSAQSAP